MAGSKNGQRQNSGTHFLRKIRKTVITKKNSSSSLLSNALDKIRKRERIEKMPEYYIGPSTSISRSTTKTWTSYLDDDHDNTSCEEEDNNQNITAKIDSKENDLEKEIEMKEKLLEIERERLVIAQKLLRAEKRIQGINKHTSL